MTSTLIADRVNYQRRLLQGLAAAGLSGVTVRVHGRTLVARVSPTLTIGRVAAWLSAHREPMTAHAVVVPESATVFYLHDQHGPSGVHVRNE